MKIAFVGKGGSGKSTLSTLMSLWLASSGKTVLAVDADHNMDFSYNLGMTDAEESTRFLGGALSDIVRAVGLPDEAKYDEVFATDPSPMFRITPGKRDEFTKRYAIDLPSGIALMTSGPHTERVLYGQVCSHALSTPLKVYLPLLDLRDDEYAILDEKAGADGVGTGIITGVDFAGIVVEPSVHSIKVARQIADLLEFYGTPYIFIGNKVSSDEDEKHIMNAFDSNATVIFQWMTRRGFGDINPLHQDSLSKVLSLGKSMNRRDSLDRTKEKFRKNKVFSSGEKR